EAGRLAGAGLGGAEKVASCEDDGDGLGLDGCGLGIALLGNRAQQLGQKPEAFESRTDGNLLKDRPGGALRLPTGFRLMGLLPGTTPERVGRPGRQPVEALPTTAGAIVRE